MIFCQFAVTHPYRCHHTGLRRARTQPPPSSNLLSLHYRPAHTSPRRTSPPTPNTSHLILPWPHTSH
ncbi:hypothetical protein E2C01_066125 [Portunus trituberculatus]|uniref:Uncharacterized protein n=1 Tax=Portunus trituberculatus TaxID=210409 RepID=A0A5B7HQ79_PORTR|nr:hypothetical protein [Portunus trituberculatus]